MTHSVTLPTPPRWASLDQVADYLSCTPRTVRRYIATGTLKAYRFGGRYRIDLDEVDAAIRAGHVAEVRP
jgi:excisionase family DNA binding protein